MFSFFSYPYDKLFRNVRYKFCKLPTRSPLESTVGLANIGSFVQQQQSSQAQEDAMDADATEQNETLSLVVSPKKRRFNNNNKLFCFYLNIYKTTIFPRENSFDLLTIDYYNSPTSTHNKLSHNSRGATGTHPGNRWRTINRNRPRSEPG